MSIARICMQLLSFTLWPFKAQSVLSVLHTLVIHTVNLPPQATMIITRNKLIVKTVVTGGSSKYRGTVFTVRYKLNFYLLFT
jgi:hypothetical protein